MNEITLTDDISPVRGAIDESFIYGKVKKISGGAGPSRTGTCRITNTGLYNVGNYAFAQVEDADLVAGNIKEGVNILGVEGTYTGGESETLIPHYVEFEGYGQANAGGISSTIQNMDTSYAPGTGSRPKRKISSRMNFGLDSFAAGTYLYRYGGSFLLYSEDGQTFTSVTTPWHIGSDQMDHGSIPEELRTPRRRLIAELGGLTYVWPERDFADLNSRTVGYINLRHSNINARLLSVQSDYSTQANAVRIPAVIPQDQWAEKNLDFREGDGITFSGALVYPENNLTAVVRGFDGLHEVRDLKDSSRTEWYMFFDDDTFRLPNHLQLTLRSSITAGDYYADIGCTDAALLLQDVPAMSSNKKIYVKFQPGTGNTYSFDDIDEIRIGDTGDLIQFTSATLGLTAATINQDPMFVNEDVSILPFNSTRIQENVGTTWQESVIIERQVPMLMVLLAHKNRFFGAKGDTIYVSKWGDPCNWNIHEELTTDSFSITSNTPGDFIGGIVYNDQPYFFKTDRFFALTGSNPTDYALVETQGSGVEADSGYSLAVLDNKIFYLSGQGPRAFDGTNIITFNGVFDNSIQYTKGNGAATNNKYYLNVQDPNRAWHLFVYDLETNQWMQENSEDIVGLCSFKGEMWSCTQKGYMHVLGHPSKYPVQFSSESSVSWYAEFEDILNNEVSYSSVKKYELQLYGKDTCEISIKIKFNGDEEWTTIFSKTFTEDEFQRVEFTPEESSSFSLRFEGTGECIIQNFIYYTEQEL